MLRLSSCDKEMLSGNRGAAAQFAMQMMVSLAESQGAEQLIDIAWAHVASAYNQGQVNLDFARRLADGDARVVVPTTLTACAMDLRNSTSDSPVERAQLELIDAYVDMGCDPVMTCAPYHTRPEPRCGEQLAWSESSAVVYANSVLGARSNRYVEFLDMCAALTGRVPDCGLHTDHGRRASVLFRLSGIPNRWYADDWFFHALGIFVGQQSGTSVPAIQGLAKHSSAEQLRALGSAAASSGSVSMFHAIGLTPEARTLDEAFQGRRPARQIRITADDIRRVAAELGAHPGERLTAVCLGAPHASFSELELLHRLLDGRQVASGLEVHVATSAAVAGELESAGLLDDLMRARVNLVIGRCTYYRPAVPGAAGHVMTNSAKWAHYAPSGLGATVTFATLADCVESACAGRVMLRESATR